MNWSTIGIIIFCSIGCAVELWWVRKSGIRDQMLDDWFPETKDSDKDSK